jgi:hypothetical protein
MDDVANTLPYYLNFYFLKLGMGRKEPLLIYLEDQSYSEQKDLEEK